MIHSLCGGVLSDGSVYTFAKISVEDAPYWYVTRIALSAGDRVLVPFGKRETPCEGTVMRVETCTAQTAPVPVARAKEVIKLIEKKS